MSSNNAALDDFIDDCFIDEDPVCKGESLELIASQLISELLEEEYNERKVA